DLKLQYNLADVCLNVSRLDRPMFEKMLAKHASGVHLLGAPQAYGDVRAVTVQGVTHALTMARKLFSYVVADLDDCFHEEQLPTPRRAPGVVVLSRLASPPLRTARRILQHFHELDVPRSRVRVVVNRYGQPYELPVAEAEQALGEKLTHFIPD